VVPYGLVRLALQQPTPENMAVVIRLFGGTAATGHFFNAVDDRYVSHYIGQSLFRAVLLLEQAAELPVAMLDSARSEPPAELVTASGHFRRRTADGQSSLVTLRKGGIFSHHAAGGFVHDFGWLVQAAGRQYISHWWSDDWKYGQTGRQLWVEGALYEHRDIANTPAKHMVLRLASRVAGNRLIGLLKKKLIFKKVQSPIRYRRTVEWLGGEIRVVDAFSQLPAGAEFLPAPRSSKRHVASADSFHREDFQSLHGFELARQFNPSAQGMEIVTSYCKAA
jgi:hypothetical protein